MKPTTKAYSGIILLAISWGTIPLIIRTSDITSISLVGIRTFLGTFFLATLLLRKNLNIKELIKPGLILGPLLAIHWVTMFESIELNSIAVGIGLVFSYPLFVLLFEFLRGNKPKSYQVFLISIGFIGLYFLLDISNIISLEGIFYGLISAISLSLIIIIGEKFSSQLGGLKVAFSQLLVASIILIKFTYESREWLIENFAVSIFLGFFLTGVGLTTYWYVVKVIKPIAVSTISYLEPVTGVILGAFLLNENLSSKQLVGFILVLLVGIGQIYFDFRINSASKV
ncbi:EamA family transporter [Acidimicrobiia bacterium]|jgi:drug/metabolite transporter (DMT)-like permease|nr:EamA family transporter [Acidimicrobiia bacterium]MDA8710318.1 EamA family transporter [Candidatus Actinomarina sp.]MDA8719494.1 EamA family transporter [Candidatus Actinomarina sp.]MDA9173398.1 EamA family transporter [Acidimicrobiia bacterium]MDA9198308.1 EamA family transporter [Acidimicrobiia bacterium]|tara:strand:- start:412 stop:1263 length:852 start_codon:yes stop_codon:yes gene_type:complete